MEVFLQALVNGILLGGFYSLMGMGQNIIFGVMNIVNFCHGEMLMVGMYITYVLYTYFGVDPLRSASHRRSAHVRSGLHPRRILCRHLPGPAGADERAVHQPVLQ